MKYLLRLFVKGKKCQCDPYMFAEREDVQAKGTWVYYVCKVCGWTAKEFE